MKIAVIGNCQARSVAHSAEVMTGGTASIYGLAEVRSKDETFGAFMAQLADADVVLSLPFDNAIFAGADRHAIRRVSRQLVFYPYLTFTGQQPDCTYVVQADGRHAPGPLGPYHSALAAAAWCEGLSATRTAGLFNAFVFAGLGYFDEAPAEIAALHESLTAMGYDLSDFYSRPMMHTINHPRHDVLHELTRQALVKAVVTPRDQAKEVRDILGLTWSWPIYPKIGERLGLEGSWGFQARAPQGDRLGSVFTLGQMIQRAFAAYNEASAQPSAPLIERARALIRANVI